jgi:hypothetical protein
MGAIVLVLGVLVAVMVVVAVVEYLMVGQAVAGL